MNKMILKSLLVSSLLSVSAFGYSASSIDVKWVGFKSKAKVGIPGTFNTVKLDIKSSDDFNAFLASAKVSIDTMSINSKMKFRDKNITSTLFKESNAKEITAMVKKVSGDMSKGTLDVEIVMNKTAKTIPMNYEVKGNKLIAKGSVDVLNFAMKNSFAAFAAKCRAFHANKTWSDVEISFELPFTK